MQHAIARLVLESVAEYLAQKVLEVLCTEFFVTQLLDFMRYLSVTDLDKCIVAILRLVVNVDSRDVAFVDQEDKQVTERNEVVPAAGHHELELVSARENHVPAEDVDLALRLVHSLLLTVRADGGLRILCCKAEVDDVYRYVLENVHVFLRAIAG